MEHLTEKSLARLKEVHPDLQAVMVLAAENYETKTGLNIEITEGLRSLDRQRQLVMAGASQTLKSRHLTGHAVDVCVIVAGKAQWDWPIFEQVGQFVKEAAASLDIPVVWGGDWKMRDGPHFELDREKYP